MPAIIPKNFQADIDALEAIATQALDNNMINAFKLAVQGALVGPQSYADGFIDEFEDESGVDTANCVDQSYDVTNDLYSKTASDDLCTGGTVLSGGDDGEWLDDYAFDNNETTFFHSLQVDPNVNGVSYLGYQFAAAKVVGVFKIKQKPDMGLTSVIVQYSDNGSAWTTLETVAIASDTVFNAYTLSTHTQSHVYWRLLANSEVSVGTVWGVYEIEFRLFPVVGFTLISENVTAEANDPITGRVILFVDLNSETITENTDLIASVSMDDGSNWDAVTLSSEGAYESGKNLYVGDVGMTARTNKEMVIKLVTANEKDVYLEGWSFLWRY